MGVSRAIEAAVSSLANLGWMGFQAANRLRAGRIVSAALGAAAAAQELGTHVARSRLAPDDRLALPHLRARDARARFWPAASISRRDHRQPRRRDQGADRRARRQDHHGENVPRARHVHRRARHQPGVPEAHRAACSPAATTSRVTDQPAQSRHLVDQVRPRLGADDRPDQPLQHDVRSVLHGRESGRLRPRAVARRGQEDPRRCDHDQAAPADDGAVLGRRADHLADLPGRRSPTRGRSATSARRPRPTASASRRIPTSRWRRPRPACASPICSSTASAKKPTRTARSATSSR